MTNEQNLKFHITEIVAEGFRLLNNELIVQDFYLTIQTEQAQKFRKINFCRVFIYYHKAQKKAGSTPALQIYLMVLKTASFTFTGYFFLSSTNHLSSSTC